MQVPTYFRNLTIYCHTQGLVGVAVTWKLKGLSKASGFGAKPGLFTRAPYEDVPSGTLKSMTALRCSDKAIGRIENSAVCWKQELLMKTRKS